MCRGSSTRRRRLRLQLSANRKLTVTWWIGESTVGVVNIVKSTMLPYLKASEGAERSCRHRRRLRGLRRGKKRSRECHSRSNAPPPTQTTKEPKVRSMNMHLRACDFWYERQEEFSKLFKQSHLCHTAFEMVGLGYPLRVSSSTPAYSRWLSRWRVLRGRIVPCGEGVVWCSRIGPSFPYWMEQRFGILVGDYNVKPSVDQASLTLLDWSSDYRIRHYEFHCSPLGNRSRGGRFVFRCAFCRGSPSWRGPHRFGRCHQCSRPAAGSTGRGRGR